MAASEPTLLCACSACRRRFAVVGEASVQEPPPCPCGGALTPEAPPSGVYELHPPRSQRARPLPRASDLGYGESHGYGPAHGGPTGPGDAPAPTSERAPASRRKAG